MDKDKVDKVDKDKVDKDQANKVRHAKCFWSSLDSSLILQAYILNLPIGHKISNVARDAVKLRDFKWTLNELNKRKWKTWVSRKSNLCKLRNSAMHRSKAE